MVSSLHLDASFEESAYTPHPRGTLVKLFYTDHDTRDGGTKYSLQPHHDNLSAAAKVAINVLPNAQTVSLQFRSGFTSLTVNSPVGTRKSGLMLHILSAVTKPHTLAPYVPELSKRLKLPGPRILPELRELDVSFENSLDHPSSQLDEHTKRGFESCWALSRWALPSLERLTLRGIPCFITTPYLPPNLVKLDLTFAHSKFESGIQGLMNLLRQLEVLEELVLCDFGGVLPSPTESTESTENQTLPLPQLESLCLRDSLPRLIKMLSFITLPSPSGTSVTLEIMDNRSTNPPMREVASEALLRDLALTWRRSLIDPAPVFDSLDLSMADYQPVLDFRAWSQGSKAELRVSLAQVDTQYSGLLALFRVLEENMSMASSISKMSIAPYAGNVEYAKPAAITLHEVLQYFHNVTNLDIVGRIHGYVLNALPCASDVQSTIVLPCLSLLTVTVDNVDRRDCASLEDWVQWKWDPDRQSCDVVFKLRNGPEVTTSELNEWAKTIKTCGGVGVEVGKLERPPEFTSLDGDGDVEMSLSPTGTFHL